MGTQSTWVRISDFIDFSFSFPVVIHLEVASGPFSLLINSPWLLVFALCLFFVILSGFNLNCWKGIHFSWSNFLIFLLLFLGLIFTFHSLSSLTLGICPVEGFYLPDPSELTFANTLLLSNAAVSLENAFISLEISLQFLIFFSLFSFILAWTFVSLQIKEFRIMGLSINNSVSSCVFFFLTGLHFFHLLLGLLLLSLLLWSCSFSFIIL